MTRQKKIFLCISLAFLGLLFYASYDIASRTTFPGRKESPGDRQDNGFQQAGDSGTMSLDTVFIDSAAGREGR